MNKKMPLVVMIILMLVSLVFAYQGLSMHAQVKEGEANLHSIQSSYFGQDKVTRDSASTGSELSKQLILIKQYPSILMELKLIGVGKILTGIYVLLFGILIALMMMPFKLASIIKKK